MPELTVSLHESDIRRLAAEIDPDGPFHPPQRRRDDFAALVQQAAFRWCRDHPQPKPTPRTNLAEQENGAPYVITARDLRLGDWIAGEQVNWLSQSNGEVQYGLNGNRNRGRIFRVPAAGSVAIGSASAL